MYSDRPNNPEASNSPGAIVVAPQVQDQEMSRFKLPMIINKYRMIRAFTKYLCKPRFLFAVSKEGVKAEETEDITLAFFYRRLLRNTKVKPNGNSKFNPYDLHYMARLT